MTDPHRVKFIDATDLHCKFFLPGEKGMFGLICGASVDVGKSFCDFHHRQCFKTITPVSRKLARYDDVMVCEMQIDDSELELTELVSCGAKD
ncbi:hypothetical protein [Bradyrhizobium sp. HKCCYLS20291]|uniref:hypothetical protein n=1 Tax=Bradyrhizobium sp. HKCCYLS20291 TaxID=3420766 RepID=UPI003EBEC07F